MGVEGGREGGREEIAMEIRRYLGDVGLDKSIWKKQTVPSSDAVAIADPSGENWTSAIFCKINFKST